MADFTALPGGKIRREWDGLVIEPDPENPDYSAYLAWLEAGNMPGVELLTGSLNPTDSTFLGESPWRY